MPTTQILFFPVGNGDMTLIRLESGHTILIDVKIRASADDPNDTAPDVAKQLRRRLSRDDMGRLFVDAFLLSHPDQDHCTGLEKHFHLGAPETWSESANKILIRELWSSPMVFRRASRRLVLCDDAKAFHREARRRVECWRLHGGDPAPGNRVLILGEDEHGKTDDLTSILVKVGESFSRVNGEESSMHARLLAPFPPSKDEHEEELHTKNNSSTILNFMFRAGANLDACRFLTAGDAEVVIWERLWGRYGRHSDWLWYDLLLSPHHCSWHSLSHDSWSEEGENAMVSKDARNALSQARNGAVIVASSKAIKDDGSDPPCIRAKREYKSILKAVKGSFVCVGEPENSPDIVEFEITRGGLCPKQVSPKSFRRRASVVAPTVLVPPKSKEPTYPKMAPARPPIKPWGNPSREQREAGVRAHVSRWPKAQALLQYQFLALQERHPALRLMRDVRSGVLQVEGHVGFCGEHNSRVIRNRFRVKLRIPPDFPHSPPVVFETGGKIPSDYSHLIQDGSLCLGVPLEVDLVFALDRTLLRFIDDLVIPYLFGYSYYKEFGEMPFGERCHSAEAVLQSYQEYFGVGAIQATQFLRLLARDSECKSILPDHEAKVARLRDVRRPDCFSREFKAVKKWLAKCGYRTSCGEVIPRQLLTARRARIIKRKRRRRRVKGGHTRPGRRK